MTFPTAPSERSPKGDHNRRLALGVAPDAFAELAGISTAQLHRYEFVPLDEPFDEEVGERVGRTLERLEAERPPLVDNGGPPAERTR